MFELLEKICPWCRHKLRFFDLVCLDEHAPKKCKNCGKYLKTSYSSSIISMVLPVALCGLSIYLFDIRLLFSLSLLLLIPVLKVTLTEPLKYSLSSGIRACSSCKNLNAKFSYPGAMVCDKCLKAGKKHSEL
jgi:hypothetical protein